MVVLYWDVESARTVCILVADCQRPQSRACLRPETVTVSFEEFSPTHEFFDYTGYEPNNRGNSTLFAQTGHCPTPNLEFATHRFLVTM